MTTEQGIVVRAEDKIAWVKTEKSEACEGCSAKSYCHSMGGGETMEVAAINLAGAKEGDRVVLGFETANLVKASFLIYVVPIIGLVAGAIFGARIAPAIHVPVSLSALLLSFVSFGAIFFLVRRKGNRLALEEGYQPKVIRVVKRGVVRA